MVNSHFCPKMRESRVAELKSKEAFPTDLRESNVVLVVRREHEDGLSPEDYDFLSKSVVPEIYRITGLPTPDQLRDESEENLKAFELAAKERVAQEIVSFEDKKIGEMYISDDKQATSIRDPALARSSLISPTQRSWTRSKRLSIS